MGEGLGKGNGRGDNGGFKDFWRIFGGLLWISWMEDCLGLGEDGIKNLINSVEGGVAGVKLDGGEDGLSGCAGGGDSVVGEGSRGNGGSGSSISRRKRRSAQLIAAPTAYAGYPAAGLPLTYAAAAAPIAPAALPYNAVSAPGTQRGRPHH